MTKRRIHSLSILHSLTLLQPSEKGGTRAGHLRLPWSRDWPNQFLLGSLSFPECQLPHLESGTVRNLFGYLKGCYEKK